MTELATSVSGLTAQEADLRLQTYGCNQLPKIRAHHPVVRFLSHFNKSLSAPWLAALNNALLSHAGARLLL